MLACAVYPMVRNVRAVATGGIYAAPTNQPVMFIIIYGRGRGNAPPLPRDTFIYCPVGRSDPTPPGSFAVTAKLPGTVKTVPYK